MKFVVTLTDDGGAVPVDCRIRRFLKAALRQYGLRAGDVFAIAAGEPLKPGGWIDSELRAGLRAISSYLHDPSPEALGEIVDAAALFLALHAPDRIPRTMEIE